ncbi:MAG TPA: HlyD family efflux transporter periplasmic adaptor subunit [Rhizobiales bacterium]|nr:HlyD family efflux transporter periplasmic adaptor subunit [Hyphomicrobiales bacterium]
MEIFCSVPLLAGWLSACVPQPLAVGYAEGEYLLLAPIEPGRISRLNVVRGQSVRKGAVLAEMEEDDARIAVAQANAHLAQTQAELDNLQRGRRPEEIAVIEAKVQSAVAGQRQAELEYGRYKNLLKRNVASQAQFDQAATALDLAKAKLAEIKANLAVSRLPARKAQIAAAKALVTQARTALDQAKWKLSQRIIRSPVNGQVNDIIRKRGETVGPTAPAVSVLPFGAIKLKVYVNERYVSGLKKGQMLKVKCDNCQTGLTARITYISSEPEFTPPVIYSLKNRQKLVYLIEARPDIGSMQIKPGQIVDVYVGDKTGTKEK